MAYKDYLSLLLPQKMKPSEVLNIVATEKGQANGLASLDGSGKVPSSQLPSYVDDVLEFNEFSDFPLTGQTGKIYLDKDEDKIYRWSGSQYIEVSSSGASYQYIADGTNQSVLLGDVSNNIASGEFSVAQGNATTASGRYSHAEGDSTNASGHISHAEGLASTASGYYSHTEGGVTQASGGFSHAQGYNTIVSGDYSHVQGYGTIATHDTQHIFGTYNIADPSTATSPKIGKYVQIVGNGTSTTRSNARTLDWNGNEVLAGKLTIGTNPSNNMDVATKQYVDSALTNMIPAVTANDYGKTLIVNNDGSWGVGSRAFYVLTVYYDGYDFTTSCTPEEVELALINNKGIAMSVRLPNDDFIGTIVVSDFIENEIGVVHPAPVPIEYLGNIFLIEFLSGSDTDEPYSITYKILETPKAPCYYDVLGTVDLTTNTHTLSTNMTPSAIQDNINDGYIIHVTIMGYDVVPTIVNNGDMLTFPVLLTGFSRPIYLVMVTNYNNNEYEFIVSTWSTTLVSAAT